MPGSVESTASNEPLVTVFETMEGTPIGVVGVDAARQILDWSTNLHLA